MNADSRVVVFGEPDMAAKVKAALEELGIKPMETGELEIRDEFQVRRWFLERNPTHVFICPGVRAWVNIGEFTFTIIGTMHLMLAAMGIAEKVRVVTAWATTEYPIFHRLCELFYFEKQLDYLTMIARFKEGVTDFARRAVLEMRDVSAKEAHANRTQSQQQRREVRGQVVPEQAGGQQHGTDAKALLEVPVAAAQGTPPGDLRSERDPAASQKAQDSVYDHAPAVSSMVPADGLS